MAISHTLRHLLNSAPTRGLRNCGSGVRRPDMWSGVCRPEVWGSGVRRPRCSGVCRPKRSGVLRPLPPTLLASTRRVSWMVLQWRCEKRCVMAFSQHWNRIGLSEAMQTETEGTMWPPAPPTSHEMSLLPGEKTSLVGLVEFTDRSNSIQKRVQVTDHYRQ